MDYFGFTGNSNGSMFYGSGSGPTAVMAVPPGMAFADGTGGQDETASAADFSGLQSPAADMVPTAATAAMFQPDFAFANNNGSRMHGSTASIGSIASTSSVGSVVSHMQHGAAHMDGEYGFGPVDHEVPIDIASPSISPTMTWRRAPDGVQAGRVPAGQTPQLAPGQAAAAPGGAMMGMSHGPAVVSLMDVEELHHKTRQQYSPTSGPPQTMMAAPAVFEQYQPQQQQQQQQQQHQQHGVPGPMVMTPGWAEASGHPASGQAGGPPTMMAVALPQYYDVAASPATSSPHTPVVMSSPAATAASSPHATGGPGAVAMVQAATQPAVKCSVRWVRLSKMTEKRAREIRSMARDKGIDAATTEYVLALYSLRERPASHGDVMELRNGELWIKVVMGEDAGTATAATAGGPDGDGLWRRRRRRRSQGDRIKRPLNSFMLYRRSQTQAAMAAAAQAQTKINHQSMSLILGLMWKTETKDPRDLFSQLASEEKELHRSLHPEYKFCPQKRKKSV